MNVAYYNVGDVERLSTGVYLDPLAADGATCGSVMITRRCLQYVKEQCDDDPENFPDGFQGLYKRAGLSEAEAERQISRQFDSLKAVMRSPCEELVFLRGKEVDTKRRFTETWVIPR